MSTRGVLALVGGLVLVAGLILGFVPVSAYGVSCGSAFAGSDDAEGADFARAIQADERGVILGDLDAVAGACDGSRSLIRPFAFASLATATGLLIAAVAVKPRHVQPRMPPPGQVGYRPPGPPMQGPPPQRPPGAA